MQYVIMLGLLIIGGTVYSGLELAKKQVEENNQLVFSIENAKTKNIAKKTDSTMVANNPSDPNKNNTNLSASLLNANDSNVVKTMSEDTIKELKTQKQEEKKQMEYEKIQQDLQLITSELQQKQAIDINSTPSNNVNNVNTANITNNTPITNNDNLVNLSTTQFSLIKSLPNQDINTWASNKPLIFEFNQPVNLESFAEHLYFFPSPDNRFSGDIRFIDNTRKNIQITSQLPLKINTEYKITLTKGILSEDATIGTLEDKVITFTVK